MNQNVPIFFASDENYVPYLDVAIISIIKNASKNNNYEIIILNSDISGESQNKLLKHSKDNVSIRFFDVKDIIEPIKKQLPNVFYYGLAAYFRLFIETAFPQYEKDLSGVGKPFRVYPSSTSPPQSPQPPPALPLR